MKVVLDSGKRVSPEKWPEKNHSSPGHSSFTTGA